MPEFELSPDDHVRHVPTGSSGIVKRHLPMLDLYVVIVDEIEIETVWPRSDLKLIACTEERTA